MSSRYPILDNRPIDQWKVTELKEELKRRKLTTKGLKDDLIRRLDEALQIEREAAEASEKDETNEASKNDDANGLVCDLQPVDGVKDSQLVNVVAEAVDTYAGEKAETVETAAAETGNIVTVEQVEGGNADKISMVLENERTKNDLLDVVPVPLDINNQVAPPIEEVAHVVLPSSVDSANVEEELVVYSSMVETGITGTGSVTEIAVSCQDPYGSGVQKGNGELATKLETEDSKAQLETEDSKPQQECDITMDLLPDSSIRENQVSEVNPRLGSHIKSDSISSDSVSINEKNELKDNIIADNVKLEHDIIRPESVEPSPSNFVLVYDESHSMDVRKPHEKKAFVEESINSITSPAMKKTNSSEDVGYPEKLNLDRSSGDDSMEEDCPESKQFDSKFNDDELRENSKSSEVPIVKEEIGTKVIGGVISAGKSDVHLDNDISLVVPSEKRKFHDQASGGNNEPAKRQRRWNSEAIKGPDTQNTTPATTPRKEPTALNRSLSRSDSSAKDDAPKDRIVPPSQRSPTTSLRIDRFLRPFTLKQVQELLGKTGNVISFWMDQIKTHCYVIYSSVEEAIETRNAVYNLQWPPNGGRLLVAEFVDPQEVKMKVETPVQAAPASTSPAVPPAPPSSEPELASRQHRDQPPVPSTLPPPPPLSRLPPARDRLPSPPPIPEKIDPPIVTLDDLFRKTSATPRIYYLPLSEEQVAAKLAAQGKSMKH